MNYVVDVNGERIELAVEGAAARVNGEVLPARLEAIEGTPNRLLTVGNASHRVQVLAGEERGRYTLWIEGWRFEVEALDERARAIRDAAGAAAPASGPAPLKAPMPGLIVRVLVQPGDEVRSGQGLVVMEAMKMENELRAPGVGRVRAVRVEPGTAVEKGAVLIELE